MQPPTTARPPRTPEMASSIARLLVGYTPIDPRERAFRERMIELARHPDACLRNHFRPGHFTASAFVIAPDRTAVLLIHHKKLDRWLQPGGHVEPGDGSPLETARREVLEEVGVALPARPRGDSVFDIDVHAIPARGDEPAHEHFDLRFLFVVQSRSFDATDEVHAARWMPIVELPTLTDDESVLRAIRKV